jgi:cell division protein FtsX
VRPHRALPLAQTAPGRVLPWLTALSVYVTVVLLGVAMMADQALLALAERAQLMTVTLPLVDDGEREIGAALDVLHGEPFVIAAKRVSRDELHKLMSPWLGESLGGLPLPGMIDVRLDPLARPDLAALQDALGEAVPGASLAIAMAQPDRAGRALALLRGWSGVLALIALPAALLATAALTRFSTRLCREAVELLRCMGAPPGYVAAQFERYALAWGLRGAAGGLGLGLATLLALQYSSRRTAIADALELGLRPLDWALLAGVAAIGLLLAVAIVRLTAQGQLQGGS